MAQAHAASGADMVTVAVRRVNISDRSKESLLDYIDTTRMFILPNTAGCYTADEAIRTARLGREAGLSNWVKLEVIGDERTLFPDNEALIEATKVLVKDGFVVLPYTNDDPIACRKLEDAGAAAVMPLGAPIGSGLGIQNVNNMRIIREFARVPLIVDAGVGTASDAALAMELGADGVLMNTAIAGAEQPVAMAQAMKHAVIAGRLAYLAGRIPEKDVRDRQQPCRRPGRALVAARMSDTDARARSQHLIEQLNTLWRVGDDAEPAAPPSLPTAPPQPDSHATAPASGNVQLRRPFSTSTNRSGRSSSTIDEYKTARDDVRRFQEALAARERRMEALIEAMRTEHAEIRTSLGVLQQATHNLGERSVRLQPDRVDERRRQPDRRGGSDPRPAILVQRRDAQPQVRRLRGRVSRIERGHSGAAAGLRPDLCRRVRRPRHRLRPRRVPRRCFASAASPRAASISTTRWSRCAARRDSRRRRPTRSRICADVPPGSLGGLFAAQVVEHLEPAYLTRLLEAAFDALRPGAPIVLETINPACWFAFFESYIRDITHVRPLHPDTLKFLLIASGFQQIEIRYRAPYPEHEKLQPLACVRGARRFSGDAQRERREDQPAALHASRLRGDRKRTEA